MTTIIPNIEKDKLSVSSIVNNYFYLFIHNHLETLILPSL